MPLERSYSNWLERLKISSVAIYKKNNVKQIQTQKTRKKSNFDIQKKSKKNLEILAGKDATPHSEQRLLPKKIGFVLVSAVRVGACLVKKSYFKFLENERLY